MRWLSVKWSGRLLNSVWLACLSSTINAGEIVLLNGDRLQGDLVKLQQESITWASDSFGELVIAKEKVEKLMTTTLLKLDGHPEPCTITDVVQGQLVFSCADNTSDRISLLALEMALPYESHVAGAHSYEGELTLSGTHTRGNKKEQEWELDSDVEYRRGDFRHIVEIEAESESTDGDPSEDEFSVGYSLDWFFHQRWFWYNDISASADESKNIDERYAFGSGYGFQFWETDRSALSLESGVSFVKELFDRAESTGESFQPSSERAVWRWATDFRYQLPFSASVQHKHELLYSLKDSDDWEFDSDTALNVPLAAGLFSEFKIEYDYDNLPKQDERKADTKFSVGVGYLW